MTIDLTTEKPAEFMLVLSLMERQRLPMLLDFAERNIGAQVAQAGAQATDAGADELLTISKELRLKLKEIA